MALVGTVWRNHHIRHSVNLVRFKCRDAQDYGRTLFLYAFMQAKHLRSAAERMGQALEMVFHESLGAPKRSMDDTNPQAVSHLQEDRRGEVTEYPRLLCQHGCEQTLTPMCFR